MANNQKPLRDPLGSYQQIHPCLARIYSLELVLSMRDDIRSSSGMPPEMRRVYHKRNCTIVPNKHFQNFRDAWKGTNRTEVLFVKIVLRYKLSIFTLATFKYRVPDSTLGHSNGNCNKLQMELKRTSHTSSCYIELTIIGMSDIRPLVSSHKLNIFQSSDVKLTFYLRLSLELLLKKKV